MKKKKKKRRKSQNFAFELRKLKIWRQEGNITLLVIR